MKKLMQWICGGAAAVCFAALGGIGYWEYSLPDSYFVEQGRTLTINDTIISDISENNPTAARTASATVGETYRTTLKWLGIFPVKQVSVTVVDRPVVVLGGTPFGVKLYTDGVLVVSLS